MEICTKYDNKKLNRCKKNKHTQDFYQYLEEILTEHIS